MLEERGEKYWTFACRQMERGSVEVNYDGPIYDRRIEDNVLNLLNRGFFALTPDTELQWKSHFGPSIVCTKSTETSTS